MEILAHTTNDWMRNTGITLNMKIFITRQVFWIILEACFFKAYMYSGIYLSLQANIPCLNKTEGIRHIDYGLSVPKSLKDQGREKGSVMLGPHLNSYDKRFCKEGICRVSTPYRQLPLPSFLPYLHDPLQQSVHTFLSAAVPSCHNKPFHMKLFEDHWYLHKRPCKRKEPASHLQYQFHSE